MASALPTTAESAKTALQVPVIREDVLGIMAHRQQSIDGPDLKGLVDAAMQIAEERRDILRRMRDALKAGDHSEALKLAEALCGVNPNEQASH